MKYIALKRRIIFIIRSRRSAYERYRLYLKKYKQCGDKAEWNSGKPNSTNKSGSYILKLFYPYIHISSKKKKCERITIDIPSHFSILDSPENSLRFIYDALSRVLKFNKLELIYLNYKNMVNFDLSAEALFDYIFHELQKKSNIGFKFSGNYPVDEIAKRFEISMGIIKELEIINQEFNDDEKDTIKIFRERFNDINVAYHGKYNVSRSHEDEVTQHFVHFIDNCLLHINKELTNDGKSLISQYVSEILDNISEHSGMNKWWFNGYLDTRNANMMCEVSIFNLGKTIADTLKDLQDGAPNKQEIDAYVKKHSTIWDEQDLRTVFALQGNISSKNVSSTSSRGQGTIELISFFKRLHYEMHPAGAELKHQKMVILSGNTCIFFDEKCNIIQKDGRDLIPLNDENDLNCPPKKDYLLHSQIFFPGTIIAIRFNLPNNFTSESA